MYTLRGYQQEAKDKAVAFFNSKSKKKTLEVLPTGSGKSIIIAHIVKELAGKVLVLQPSKELLEQNYAKYANTIQNHPELVSAGIYSASVGVKERKRVTFATIGSIYKKPYLFKDVEAVIIDECHNVPPKKNSMYRKFLKEINAHVLGLTATPYRLKTYSDPFVTYGKYSQINLLPRERPKFFNEFLYVVQTAQMYEEGYLAPVRYIKMAWDGSFLKFNSTGAEYSDTSIKDALERNQVIERLPRIVKQAFAKGRKSCLVFVKSVAEAKHLASITPNAASIDAETKKAERSRIIESFKAGEIKTIYNVGVLTIGFDYPELDTVIIARPTMSLALFVQMVGRGIRIAENKEYCAVLDMCGNLDKFGKLEELKVVEDEEQGWVLRNNEKILSGVRLDELV